METWLGPASRYVDPVFHAGIVRDQVKAGSVRFVESAFEHVGLFFVAKKAGAGRFIIDARASKRLVFFFFFESSIWTVAHRGGTLPCRIPGSAQRRSKLFCGFDRYQGCASSDAHSWMVTSVFALPAVLASEVGYSGKTINQADLLPIL